MSKARANPDDGQNSRQENCDEGYQSPRASIPVTAWNLTCHTVTFAYSVVSQVSRTLKPLRQTPVQRFDWQRRNLFTIIVPNFKSQQILARICAQTCFDTPAGISFKKAATQPT
jgi:hypothetical protein